MNKTGLSAKQLTREQIEAARQRGRERTWSEPRARTAHYDAASRRIVVELCNGVIFSVPVELLQGLGDACVEDVAAVEVDANGYGLHWEKLDQDFTVPGLVAGVFGTEAWMSGLMAEPARKC